MSDIKDQRKLLAEADDAWRAWTNAERDFGYGSAEEKAAWMDYQNLAQRLDIRMLALRVDSAVFS